MAAAVETLHNATLVHDDLIDGALLRRGITTLNASWSKGATVLAGDYLFARAAGFAAETENLLEYASRKLRDKNLDLIVANDVANPSIGFNSEQNAATVIWRSGHRELAIAGKSQIATALVELIAAQMAATRQQR